MGSPQRRGPPDHAEAAMSRPSHSHHSGFTPHAPRRAVLDVTDNATGEGGGGDCSQSAGAGSVADLRSRSRGDLLPRVVPPRRFSPAPPGSPVTGTSGWAWVIAGCAILGHLPCTPLRYMGQGCMSSGGTASALTGGS